MNSETGISRRKTVDELVREFNLAMHEMKTGLDAIRRAEEHLKAFECCGNSYDLVAFRHDEVTLDFDRKKARMKRAAWRYLVDRIEVKKLASMKRAKEIDKQLHDDKHPLPEIEVNAIMAWIESVSQQARDFLAEAVVEVYNLLRPCGREYKTNSAFRIGKRVILAHRVGTAYHGKFRVNYHYSDDLNALDNVFHMLDGAAVSKYRRGDLVTQIEAAEGGTGETEYFKFKCFHNGNLHLEFKRADLVERLNSIGGTGLPDPDRD